MILSNGRGHVKAPKQRHISVHEVFAAAISLVLLALPPLTVAGHRHGPGSSAGDVIVLGLVALTLDLPLAAFALPLVFRLVLVPFLRALLRAFG